MPIHDDSVHDPLRDFDAHIYYDLERTRPEAEALHGKALRELPAEDVRVKRMVDRPIGPHARPMFELNFPLRSRELVLDWLRREHGSLSVLVHEVSGHDRRDHTDGIVWLGSPLPIDFSTFTT